MSVETSHGKANLLGKSLAITDKKTEDNLSHVLHLDLVVHCGDNVSIETIHSEGSHSGHCGHDKKYVKLSHLPGPGPLHIMPGHSDTKSLSNASMLGVMADAKPIAINKGDKVGPEAV